MIFLGFISSQRARAARNSLRDPAPRVPLDAARLTILGLVLLAASWWLAWFGPEPWSRHTFCPLWLGYILTVDGLVLRRTGSSLLTRDPVGFASLFAVSAPLWWGFEAVNARLGNWEYVLPVDYGPLAYAALATISFSTVVPALFETAELYRSLGPFRPARRWLRIAPGRVGLAAVAAGGAATIVLAFLFPRQAFPMVWLGLFFLADPLTALLGGRSLSGQVATGRWDTVWVLFAAGLTCGLLWEGWNYWSSPKWVYHVPYVGHPKLFEMPLIGYGGYFPFPLEIYAAYRFACLVLPRRSDEVIRFDDPAPAGTGDQATHRTTGLATNRSDT